MPVHIDDISCHLVGAFDHASADSGSGRTTGFPSRTEKIILISAGFVEQCLAPAHKCRLLAEERALSCAVCKERDSSGSRKDLPTQRPPISLHLSLLLLSPYSSFAVIVGLLLCNRQSPTFKCRTISLSVIHCGGVWSVGIIASDRRKAFVSRRTTPLSLLLPRRMDLQI